MSNALYGRLLAISGEYKQAIAQMHRTISFTQDNINPENNAFLIRLKWHKAKIELQNGKISTAKQIADEILNFVHQYHNYQIYYDIVNLLRSHIALEEKRWNESAEILKQLSPRAIFNIPDYLLLKARLQEAQGQIDEAIKTYQRFKNAVNTRGQYVGGDYMTFFLERSLVPMNLGRLYEKKRDIEKAIEYYEEAAVQWTHADENYEPYVFVRERLTELEKAK
jgi:tetratricopeptide (TPR) repeat protein